jgi:hypothetical protein
MGIFMLVMRYCFVLEEEVNRYFSYTIFTTLFILPNPEAIVKTDMLFVE